MRRRAPSSASIRRRARTVLSPAAPSAEVPVTTGQELAVTWTPSDPAASRESVVVSCFVTLLGGTPGSGASGASPIKGKLHIATHRQLTIFASGGSTVYVVATATRREQGFALTP